MTDQAVPGARGSDQWHIESIKARRDAFIGSTINIGQYPAVRDACRTP